MTDDSIARAARRTEWASRALSAASDDLRAAGRRGELTNTAAIACEQSAEQVAGLVVAIERLQAVTA